MTKIKVEVEFEIDDKMWGANSYDESEKKWFWDEVIPSCMILLHSNEVGDTVSEATKFKVTEVVNEITKELESNQHSAVSRIAAIDRAIV